MKDGSFNGAVLRLRAFDEDGRCGIGPCFVYVTSIDSRPNEEFVFATISQINDSRNRVDVDVDVPGSDRPALLTFSRPYFRGYKARLGNQELAVSSYRGLFPVVEVPAGSRGRLTLTYQPYWLKWGSVAAIACALIVMLGFFAAISRHR